jgi:excisionase family DNA binding protein
MEPEWLTTIEACEISGYTPQHVRYLIRSGKIQGRRWGRDWQVAKQSLLDYLQQSEELGQKRGPKPK